MGRYPKSRSIINTRSVSDRNFDTDNRQSGHRRAAESRRGVRIVAGASDPPIDARGLGQGCALIPCTEAARRCGRDPRQPRSLRGL
jgi:hypothetical protein